MKKVLVEIEVAVQDDRTQKSGLRVAYVKIDEGAAIALPIDAATPRRFQQELAAAVKKKLEATPVAAPPDGAD